MKLNKKNKLFSSAALVVAILLALHFYFKFEEKEQKGTEYQFSLIENWSIDSTSGTDNYAITLFVGTTNEPNVVITNFSNLGISVNASLINNVLKIDSQELSIKDEKIYVKGIGSISNNKLNVQYSLTKSNSVFKANCEGIRILNSTK